MDHARKLKVVYHADKDILCLETLPHRPARVDENDFGVLTRYDWDATDTIVGFEILDFVQRFIPYIHHPDAFSSVARGLRFDVDEAGMSRADLGKVLEWAYHRFGLEKAA